MISIASQCCTRSNKNIFVFRDKKNPQKLVLKNPKKLFIDEVIIDGCLISDDKIRCDFMFYIPNQELVYNYQYKENYIELKGSNLEHAVHQIINTVNFFISKYKLEKKMSRKGYKSSS